jgi:hypothetical protein
MGNGVGNEMNLAEKAQQEVRKRGMATRKRLGN